MGSACSPVENRKVSIDSFDCLQRGQTRSRQFVRWWFACGAKRSGPPQRSAATCAKSRAQPAIGRYRHAPNEDAVSFRVRAGTVEKGSRRAISGRTSTVPQWRVSLACALGTLAKSRWSRIHTKRRAVLSHVISQSERVSLRDRGRGQETKSICSGPNSFMQMCCR